MSILIIVLYCDIATESVEVYYPFIIIMYLCVTCEKRSIYSGARFISQSFAANNTKVISIIKLYMNKKITTSFEITISGDYSVNIGNLVPNNHVITINK